MWAEEWHDLTDFKRTALTTVLTTDYSGAKVEAGTQLGGYCSDPGEKWQIMWVMRNSQTADVQYLKVVLIRFFWHIGVGCERGDRNVIKVLDWQNGRAELTQMRKTAGGAGFWGKMGSSIFDIFEISIGHWTRISSVLFHIVSTETNKFMILNYMGLKYIQYKL